MKHRTAPTAASPGAVSFSQEQTGQGQGDIIMERRRHSPPLLRPLAAVGDDIYLYEPPTLNTSATSEPSLIVLCTWLGGATPRTVSKYVTGYRQMFPNAAILLVGARFSEITVTPFSVMQARLKPARNIIRRFISARQGKPSILWHIFSNGGLNTAVQLVLMVKRRHINFAESSASHEIMQAAEHALDFAVRGVILDCCPGDDTFDKTYSAATASLPRTQLSQTLGKAILYPTIYVLLTLQNAGYMSSLGDLARGLNNSAIFGMPVRRLYLYSESDEVVDWQFVEEHMALAKEKGFDVRGEMISGGSHCGLIRGNAARYWMCIEKFWKGSDGIQCRL